MTMTTTDKRSTTTPNWPLYASLGAGVSVVLTAVGTLWDLTNNESGASDTVVEYLPVVGMIAVATAIVFGLIARTPSPGKALGLGIASVLSVAAFWAGLPAVLAAAAFACAFGSPRLTVGSKIGVGLGVVAIGLAIWAAIAG